MEGFKPNNFSFHNSRSSLISYLLQVQTAGMCVPAHYPLPASKVRNSKWLVHREGALRDCCPFVGHVLANRKVAKACRKAKRGEY